MHHDKSPLAHRSIWPLAYDYDQWLARVASALAEDILNAPELVHLLSYGLDVGAPSREAERQRLNIYLSIAAGRNALEPPEGMGMIYWDARRKIEAAAWEALYRSFFITRDHFYRFAASQGKAEL